MIPDRQQILQVAWVVPDLEAAARQWHETMGIGPFLVNRHITIGNPRYRGQPQVTDFSTAVAQAGPIQIELVEQHDDTPSCYRDTVPPGATAMHHVAIMAADYTATLARYTAQGFAIAGEGEFGDVRFAYIDCRRSIGHMVEIVEQRPTIERFFAAVRRAAETWDHDSSGLLRTLG